MSSLFCRLNFFYDSYYFSHFYNSKCHNKFNKNALITQKTTYYPIINKLFSFCIFADIAIFMKTNNFVYLIISKS